MKRFFIKLKNGQPVDHPMDESNVRSVCPYIDLGNLPPEIAVFIKTEPPIITDPYKKFVNTYVRVNDVVTDSWSIISMTEEEKQEKIRIEKEDFALREGPESWIWDEDNCNFNPPVPYPDDYYDVPYRWNENIIGWERVDI